MGALQHQDQRTVAMATKLHAGRETVPTRLTAPEPKSFGTRRDFEYAVSVMTFRSLKGLA